jgi:hypothetical protein
MSTAPNPACNASVFSQLVSGNLIVCSSTFQSAQVESEQAQIQSVADNAAQNYGDDSVVANITQSAADQQEAQASSDVTAIDNAIAASNVDQFFTTCSDGNDGIAIPGLPCINYTYILYGLIALVVLYFLAVAQSFVPRPRG